MSSHAVTVELVDGKTVVTQADELIYVHDDLWQQLLSGDLAPDCEMAGGVLSLGTAGQGLGRISYRHVRHDPENRWHVMTLIP